MHLPDGLFALRCRFNICTPFEIDQLVDRILTGNATHQVALVIEHAINKVLGYANEQRTVALARQNVGTVTVAHDCRLLREDSMATGRPLAGSKKASTPLRNNQAVTGNGTVDGG